MMPRTLAFLIVAAVLALIIPASCHRASTPVRVVKPGTLCGWQKADVCGRRGKLCRKVGV